MQKSRILASALAFSALGAPLWADGYVMGAGRWSCGKAIEVYETGSPLDKGQFAGWILGYWSAATFERETAFIDTVERVGGIKIADITIAECRKAPPETPIFKVTQSMIRNTK